MTDETNKKRAVTILLHNEDGEILAVSRKNDPNDFGLPGGKVDEGETDEQAIIREVKEETGLDITNIVPYFKREDGEYLGTTFIGNYSGEIKTSEKGKVIWTDFETIKKGSFGHYNSQLENFFQNTHKYKSGDVIINPETMEGFMILGAVPTRDFAKSGYFVNVFCSDIGYAFIKKSAVDSVRMRIVVDNTDANDLEDLAEGSAQYFACAAHFDTNHYYGKNDSLFYSYHLKKVVDVGRKFKHLIPSEDWVFVESGLWTHDCIEDVRKTYNDVKKTIGISGASISFALANSTGMTRHERADDAYYAKIRGTKYGTFAKLCDRIANIEYSIRTKGSMAQKYKEEHQNFKYELYVAGEYESMWEYLENLIKSL